MISYTSDRAVEVREKGPNNATKKAQRSLVSSSLPSVPLRGSVKRGALKKLDGCGYMGARGAKPELGLRSHGTRQSAAMLDGAFRHESERSQSLILRRKH
jgi:hypothetical protein